MLGGRADRWRRPTIVAGMSGDPTGRMADLQRALDEMAEATDRLGRRTVPAGPHAAAFVRATATSASPVTASQRRFYV